MRLSNVPTSSVSLQEKGNHPFKGRWSEDTQIILVGYYTVQVLSIKFCSIIQGILQIFREAYSWKLDAIENYVIFWCFILQLSFLMQINLYIGIVSSNLVIYD